MQRQTWDPSVKSMTAVPQVLQMMSDKLDWTKQLGDAYLAQPDDMTQAIQRLRVKAADAGNLKTTKEQKVSRVWGPAPGPGLPPEQDYIAIEPVDPAVIFVPVYNPRLIYGVGTIRYSRRSSGIRPAMSRSASSPSGRRASWARRCGHVRIGGAADRRLRSALQLVQPRQAANVQQSELEPQPGASWQHRLQQGVASAALWPAGH